jgi:type I restriction enzyme R subunit
MNQNPEQIARDKIDQMLVDAAWLVQSKDEVNLSAGKGVALRETNTESGSADYILFVNSKAVGVIEAKAEELGFKLLQVEEQSVRYSKDAIKIGKFTLESEKPFVYESTGTVTRFTDYRDPKPRGRNVFSFHKPSTIEGWIKKGISLRERLLSLPNLDTTGLRPAQIVAIENLENSFKRNRPKALIQMATGAGKTFTAATFIYRLLKHVDAKRILFLVDTKNLGEQAEQEFMTFQPNDDNRKFTELYNIQRLTFDRSFK